MEDSLKNMDRSQLQAPNHVAIILDGNGRWAKKRLLPRKAGHVAGSKTVEKIGEDAYNKTIDYINKAKNFYRFDRTESGFHWAMMNCSPCSNKQTVIDYWKSQGVDLEIEERDPDFFYDRYYCGITEKELENILNG